MVKFVSYFCLLTLSSCATLLSSLPEKTSFEERMAMLPQKLDIFEKGVQIDWDNSSVPFIQAKTDLDLARAMGVVHAHLRWGQMETFKRAAQGRLSETAGFITEDLDKAFRVLNFGGGVEASIREMDEETRQFLNAFVLGLNAYMDNAEELPHEFNVFNWSPEPWAIQDVLLLSRLAATDVNWIIFAQHLLNEDKKKADQSIQFLRELSKHSKSGSNAWAVQARHSQTGHALMANDPHLGLVIPNFWMLIAFQSPSYHAVGMTIPGIPFVALGRTEHISWGGTNMRGMSTDIIELDPKMLETATTKKEKIAIRLWPDSEFEYRVTDWGPQLNEVPIFSETLKKPLAFKWRGHSASQELHSLLQAMKAKNVDEFHQAFEGYAVSGQNFLVADKAGSVGLVRAVEIPNRSRNQVIPVVHHTEAKKSWGNMLGPLELPFEKNPSSGWIVSANEEPDFSEPVLGFFFAPDQRKDRIEALLSKKAESGQKFNLEDFQKIQMDVKSPSSLKLKNKLLALGVFQTTEAQVLMRSWKGDYSQDERAPVFFVNYLFRLLDVDFDSGLARSAQIFDLWNAKLSQSHVAQKEWQLASIKAEKFALSQLTKFPTWGDFHRLRVAHPAANIPLIGSKYIVEEGPVDGGIETVFKTAHALTDERHFTSYGTQARHLSDMSDSRENHFILFGGNDGWFGSENYTDMVSDWREGNFIQVPLNYSDFKEQSVFSIQY